MTHPTPAELLELHFGESGPARASRLAAHARRCPACHALLADVAWAESLLSAVPAEEPPADGLDRVLARISNAAPAASPTPAWRAALPSAAALGAGGLAAALGGVTAALVFLAAGSLVTLSLAPALILDSQRRGGAPLAR